MTTALVDLADQHRYQELFLKHLRWNAPDTPPQTVHLADGTILTVANVSTYEGIRVWVCDQLPGAKAEVEVDKKLASTTTDRLVIFHNDDEQIWRWPVRRDKGHLTTTRLARHRHRAGAPDPNFAHRLAAIQLPTDTVLEATAVLARVREAFDVERQNETRHASKLMAAMYTAMEKSYPANCDPRRRDHEISVTLARILFLMFGDDTDMWQPDAFRDLLLEHTTPDGANLQPTLQDLFEQLNSPASDTVTTLPYVNGGIFREQITLPPVSTEFRKAVLDACAVDWSTISPAIFGSMFQSVRDAATRRALGEHYTSEQNILKTLNPLFLDELHAELGNATTVKALNKLWDRLGDIRFLDPACGCGNFIIVAYRELRDLELQVMERLQTLHHKEGQLEFEPTLALKVRLSHFYGIEIDEWPARIAETAMFLIDRQCDLKLKEKFGEAPQRLPIQQQATITVGSALQLDWDAVLPATDDTVIAGNPPFLGITERSPVQTAELKAVWGGRYHGSLDYVTGWHRKTLDYFGKTPGGRWALVSTNSITQGEPVAPLFDAIHDEGWAIKFAHRTFKWTSEAPGPAGAVHCVIIGFAKHVAKPRLFDYATPEAKFIEISRGLAITPYLTEGPWLTVRGSTRPISSQMGQVYYGSKPSDGTREGVKGLVVTAADRPEIESDPIARKYLRRYVGAKELLYNKERYCLWLVDATPEEIQASPVLSRRVNDVHEFRSAPKRGVQSQNTPAHLFAQRAHPNQRYLCIPRHVSELRPYFLSAWMPETVIAGDANFTALDPDGFVFAIISSKMYLVWQATVGGRLESRLRFNKLLAWNTFPLPEVSAEARAEIINAGRAVLGSRSADLSLDEMYETGRMSTELTASHQELDRLIDKLFGIDSPALMLLERQEILFSKYRQYTERLLAGAAGASRRPRKRL